MAAGLTPKQEAFCLAYVETGNASGAYRTAGYSANSAPKTINEAASRLLADRKISARVDELKAAHVARHEVTIDTIAEMLREDRTFARDLENPSSAVTATQALAKLYGLFTDKHEHSGGVIVQILRLGDEA